MKFIDEAKIEVFAGDGGDGCRSFRREKYVPRGGPNGGDGGRGGHVIARADEGLATLLDVSSRHHVRASRGEHGRGKEQYGANGKDVLVRLPVGTVVRDRDTGEVITDLTKHGMEVVIARGGYGGRGNKHFRSATNQTPEHCEPGRPGQQRIVQLELKLLADVGLIGLPNAGKSTLIASISKARPKIADYPFTTTVPNLGVVQLGITRSFTVADIPGLIEGAHTGVGLGHQFLRHIERTRVLLHLIDVTDPTHPDPVASYHTIRTELAAYDGELAKRPEIVVFTKQDLPEAVARATAVKNEFVRLGREVFTLSAATHTGLEQLLEVVWQVLQRQ